MKKTISIIILVLYVACSLLFAPQGSADQIDSLDSATSDWSTTDAVNFTLSNESTIVNEGSGSAKIVSAVTQGQHEYIYRSFGSTQDFSDTDNLYVDVRSSLTGNIMKWHMWENAMSGTTAYSQSMTVDLASWNYSFRNIVSPTTSGNQFRVRAVAHSSASSTYTGWTVGERSGSTANCVSGTWKPITFSGSTSVTVPAGSSTWSDWIDYDISNAKSYFITAYPSSGNVICVASGLYYFWAGNYTATQDWSGAGGFAYTVVINAVQVRTVPEKIINVTDADTWETITWDITGETDSEIDAVDRMSFRAMSSSAATMYLDNVTDVILPPTGVSATDGEYEDKVTIRWDAVTGATGYEVWRNTIDDSASATRIQDGYGTTSYNDETVTGGVTYYYWVKTEIAASESDFSASDSGYAVTPPPISIRGSGKLKIGSNGGLTIRL